MCGVYAQTIRKMGRTTHVVCHLTSVHNRYDNRIFFKECCSLASHGWEVHFIVADDKGDEVKSKVNIWDVGSDNGRCKRFFRTTRKVYEKALIVDADIYHFHDPDLIPIGLKLKKKDKIVVYDSHEDFRTQIKIRPWLNQYLRGMVSYIFGKYEDYAMKRFDGILVPQWGMIDYFKDLNENTKLVANTIIIDDKFDLADKDYTNKICFHPGTLTKERGVQNMVKAFEFLNGEELILAGTWDSNELFESTKKLNGWHKVNYLGNCPYSEIKEYHKKASIGLILFEDIGQYHFAYTVKLFEYMYFGTPVIMPNFGDWVEFNKKYQCGITVDTGNPELVAKEIKFLNENPSIKKELGTRGRSAVMDELNWGTDERRLLQFYDALVDKNQHTT